MEEKLNDLRKIIINKVNEVNNLNDLNNLKVEYLSKKSEIGILSNSLKEMSIEDKKVYGKLINDFKNEIINLIDNKKEELEEKELNKKLENEKIDINLPATRMYSRRSRKYFYVYGI